MSLQSSQPPALKPEDEAAIRALFQQMLDGWNRSDGNAFAGPFAEDSDFVGFDGTYLKGRQEIASFHQQLFDMYLKGTLLVGKARDVLRLSPDVARMQAVGGTVLPGQS